MRRAGATALCLLLAGTATGCGMWTRGEKVGFSDEVIATTSVRRPVDSFRARLEQQGLTLRVKAVSECAVVEQEQIERTHEYDRKSQAAGIFGTIGVGGAVVAAAGGVALARASDAPSDPPEHSDELSRTEAYGYGGAAIGIGSLMTVSALIHWAVVSKEDETTETLTEDGVVLERSTFCKPAVPRQGLVVWLETRTGRVELGATAADGTRTVDLASRVPRHLVVGPYWQKTALVGVADLEMREVDLAPVRAHYEAETWADAEPTRCAAPEASDDCDGVERYLTDFPDGEHAARARELLDQAQQQLRRIAEREEAERQAEAERRRAELERQRLEAERERRELEEQRRREQERREAEAERRRRELERERRERKQRAEQARREREARERRREQRRKCMSKCRSTCSGNAECVRGCVQERCP